METENKTSSKRFYEKYPEKLTKSEICEMCGGKYKYCNKSHHKKTKLHRMVEKALNSCSI